MTTCTVTLTLVLSAGPAPTQTEVQKALERTRRMRAYQRELMRSLRGNGGAGKAHAKAGA
jgi:hypothetical protein